MKTRGLWCVAMLGALVVSVAGCKRDSIVYAELPKPLLVSTPREPLVVPQGWNGSMPVIVDNTVARAGTLSLAVYGLPTGVTGVFSKPTLTVSVDTSVLVLEVAVGTVPGNYTLTVVASAGSGAQGSASRPLTVTVPAISVSRTNR
jgi:hypothetical protein